ncbi:MULTISPECIES: recombinase family protein [Clostridium]|uniref:Recombinase family protein n=1 Tax=Clostridium frigoriphilum TaxID=443253 RepID=A0ABU7UVE7_9CLOT|nr:recombinase family protein [Clostridium sp. DSM 17811]MBU3098714.1 recombinase family protein [Clostridium sp. DSM 17811]
MVKTKVKQLVGVYARVSTDDQHTSIENQHIIFYKWIEEKGYELFKIYTDEAISGTKGIKRLEWQRLLQDGRDKKYNILVAKSFSRFGRNQRETLDAIKDLRAVGIRVIFIEDNLDSLKDANNFGLFAWLAEQEAQRTSERLKLIWEGFNKDGRLHVCLPPFGYDYDLETKNYIINYNESEWVRQIFSWYLQGYGFNKIATMLKEKEVATKRGGVWASNTVRCMISNEAYIGTLVQGYTRSIDVTMTEREKIPEDQRYRHANNHTQIIDDEIFYKVQDILAERSSKAKGSYAKVKSRHSNASLYSNLLVCGECQGTMSIKRKKALQDYKPFYNCMTYDLKGIKSCGHKSNFLWEDVISTFVRNNLEDIARNDFKELKQIFKDRRTSSRPKSVEEELKDMDKKIEQYLKLSMDLMMNHGKGLVGDTQLKLQNETIEKNLSSLISKKEEYEKIPKEIIKNNDEIAIINSVNNLLAIPNEEWTNSILKVVIEKIVRFIDGTIDIKFKYLNSKDGTSFT